MQEVKLHLGDCKRRWRHFEWLIQLLESCCFDLNIFGQVCTHFAQTYQSSPMFNLFPQKLSFWKCFKHVQIQLVFNLLNIIFWSLKYRSVQLVRLLQQANRRMILPSFCNTLGGRYGTSSQEGVNLYFKLKSSRSCSGQCQK